MIENVKNAIYTKERKKEDESSIFYGVVYEILIDGWNKNSTPLHCLAHSLNPRYYSNQWLNDDPKRVPPHKDPEVSKERVKCFKKYFRNLNECNKVAIEYASFIDRSREFGEFDSIINRYDMDPKTWWLLHGSHSLLLQIIALKLLVHFISCRKKLEHLFFCALCVGLFEVANLSLDEPELESVIFNDNKEADGGDAKEANEVEIVTS
ncbi:hypothetical protein Q3G72_026578 [Acer saccharum]|nr:hypothetical protein Q3G72_026578 [Acer saccharum]